MADRDLALAVATALTGLAAGQRRLVIAVRYLAPPLDYSPYTRKAIDQADRAIEEIEGAERSILTALRCLEDRSEADDDGGPDRMTNEGGPCVPSDAS